VVTSARVFIASGPFSLLSVCFGELKQFEAVGVPGAAR